MQSSSSPYPCGGPWTPNRFNCSVIGPQRPFALVLLVSEITSPDSIIFMFRGYIIWALLIIAHCSIQKGYTLYHPREYNDHHFGNNDNTTHVIIGTYLNGKNDVDALKITEAPYSFGINLQASLGGKTRYYKVFGSGQKYDELMTLLPQTVATGINNNRQLKAANSFIIIDWDQKLFEQAESKLIESLGWLQKFLVAVPNTILKIPAHYLCKTIGGTPFYKHINHTSYIIEMYGRENPYLTYDSIFSKTYYNEETDGYSDECPKNPSTAKLKQIFDNKIKFNIQKTLHMQYRGYIGEMDQWIAQAGKDNLFQGVVFFDQHPVNTIRI